MKRISLMLLVPLLFMLTGCTKKYKTFNEYYDAMKKLKSANNSYIIETKQSAGNNEVYYRTYVKGLKWKTESSLNGGNSYADTILYDGTDVLTYTPGSPDAIVNPFVEILDDESKNMAINAINPTNVLINWKDLYSMMLGNQDSSNPEIIENNTSKNGFKCRLIKLDNEREACVSDKYGIAVYHKMNGKTLRGKTQTIITNLVKIEIKDIPNSTFDLPPGVKKADLTSVLDKLNNSLSDF